MPREVYRWPTDPLTGLPHPVLTKGMKNPPLATSYGKKQSYHHTYGKRRDKELEGKMVLSPDLLLHPERLSMSKLAGLTMRMCRGQSMTRALHDEVHDKYLEQPTLATTVHEKHEKVAKACSGVVSRFAIDPTVSPDDDSRFVYMDNELFDFVAKPSKLSIERVYVDKPEGTRRRILGNFFLRFGVENGLAEVVRDAQDTVSEFLDTKNDRRRLELGGLILLTAMDVTLDPVATICNELDREGMVQHGDPAKVISLHRFVDLEGINRVMPNLEQALAA